ncbi:MAG: sensor histidine kinase [Planctomycetota bacterium]
MAGTLILLCLGIIALGFLYVYSEHKLIEKTIYTVTSETGKFWARTCADIISANDLPKLQMMMEIINSGRDVQRVVVMNQDGLVIASTDPNIIGQMYQEEHGELLHSEAHIRELHPRPHGFFHESGHNFEFRFPIEHNKKHFGTLVVEINTAWGNQQAKALAVRGLWGIFFFSLIMGMAAIALDWRLRGAVKRLIAITQAIARGQLSERVHLGTRDELDMLGDSVNQMAQALRESEDRIQHWHRHLEETIAQRTKELEHSQELLAHREKIAALGLMAAGVAHEVGNPLAAVSTILQRIEREAQPGLREKCKVMEQQIERISRIVDEMRQFAGPACKKDELVNVNEALRLSMQVCRYDPRAKNIKMTAELDPNIPTICGNTDRWQQVFLNLIVNAFDAMPNGGSLNIASGMENGYVSLLFQDSGKGMNPQQISNLFHPFYTTKDPGRGSGLGLSVCEGIVSSCGGEIKVDSVPGYGTTFRITIPVNQSKPDKNKKTDPLNHNSSTLPNDSYSNRIHNP